MDKVARGVRFVGRVNRMEKNIEQKEKQIKLLQKEIATLKGFVRQHYFSMMGGRGVY